MLQKHTKHNGDRKNNNDNQWKLNKPPRKHFWRRNNVTEQLTVDNWQKPKCKGSHGGMLKRSSGEEEKDTSVLSSHYHLVLLREKKTSSDQFKYLYFYHCGRMMWFSAKCYDCLHKYSWKRKNTWWFNRGENMCQQRSVEDKNKANTKQVLHSFC